MNFVEKKFIRFIIIGTITSIINYSIFMLLLENGINYLVSSSIGYISGLIIGYFLNKNYNFYLKNYKNTFLKYILIYFSNLIISILILKILVDIYEINPYISNFLVLIYSTISNYIGLKYFVFKNKILLAIGISGDSGTGKSTLTKLFKETIGLTNVSILNGDSSHKWERNNPKWNKISHLDPKGNNLNKEVKTINDIKNGLTVKRKFYDHSIGKYTEIKLIESNPFIIYEGLHSLYKNINNLFDIKIFIESNYGIKNKINRDINERNRDTEKLLENIEKRKEDYKKYILPQKENANIIINNIEKNNQFFIKILIKDGIDSELFIILNKIKGIKIINNEIEINQNISYNIENKISKSNLIKFIKYFNPNINITNSYKGLLKIILIYLIKKYANNNTNGWEMK